MENSPVVSEINYTPVKPKKSHIGFISFILNDQFYLSSIAVHTRLKPSEGNLYRLVYPEDQSRKLQYFHPINKDVQELIEKEANVYINELLKD